MAQDLSGLYISQSFQNLIQRSASGAFNVLATATGTEFIPVSASYAISSSHTSNADNAISSSYAVSSSHAVNSDNAISSSYASVNLQQVLENGNTASLGFKVTGDGRVDGKLIVSGSSNSVFDIDGFDLEITGGLDVSRDVAVRDDLTVYDDTNLRKDVNVGYRGDSPGFGYSLAVTQSINNSGSAKFVGKVDVTGSIIGSTSILAGQNAAAFGGDSIILGSSTNPVQYGNVQIYNNLTTNIGNKFNAYQIVEMGGQNLELASTAFSGLGNHIHLLGMGGNSVGRADNIKLWSSGSQGELNLSTDVKIQDANKLSMSGSIELGILGSNLTGSVGQVIGVSTTGNAEWQTAASPTAFPYTGSAQITGSLAVTGSQTLSLNELGTVPTLVIEDKANNSYSVGPTLKFSGSRVGIIESDDDNVQNLQIDAKASLGISIGQQLNFTKASATGDAYQFINNGSLWAKFQNENLRSTGSITFADPTIDVGIGLRMDNDKMALQMYSGSSFVPIIQRASGSQQVNLYDSSRSSGSSAQVLTSNANGGIEWAAAGGGGGGITSFSLEPRSITYTSASAPGADVIFMTASIPGGTFVPGDVLELRALYQQTGGTSGTNYSAIGIASGSWAPGTPYPYSSEYYGLASLQNGVNGKAYFQKTLFITSATETTLWSPNTNDSAFNAIDTGDPVETHNIDWTTDQTFHFGSNIENTTTTQSVYGGIIRKIN